MSSSPPGRCGLAALLLAVTVGVLALLGFFSPARAEPKKKDKAASRPGQATFAMSVTSRISL